VKFRGSVRMIVPAARLDVLTFSVSPAVCAGETRFSAARFNDVALPKEPAPTMTDLFFYVQAPRKNVPNDELYNTDADPAMIRNLRDSEQLTGYDRALAERFQAIAAVDVADHVIPPEEQQRLRSLGYLQ